MKENLRQFWSQENKATAQATVDSWVERARSSGIGPLVRVVNALAGLTCGILNWYGHPKKAEQKNNECPLAFYRIITL